MSEIAAAGRCEATASLPLSGYRNAADPVLLSSGGSLTAGAFFAQAERLARALPAQSHVINLCESRHAFMLAFAAALIRGQTTLMPAGQDRKEWEKSLEQFPHACLLSDKPLAESVAINVLPFMEAADQIEMPDMPQIRADLQAAILFTSGSTGKPGTHIKTWAQLWRGAEGWVKALRWQSDATPYAVVGSVPPQHMFGLESTVMLPWFAGAPVHTDKPFFGADLERALSDCARPAWWMTTPPHMRAPLASPQQLPNLQGVVASTAALPAELAEAAEATWKVPVTELYGSTETGALATRRTTQESLWTPLPGVSLQYEGDGGDEERKIRVAAPHVMPPVLLGDRLDLQADGRFLSLGRASDLIKVAGKRASLAALNQTLSGIPGVVDACFLPPDESAGSRQRLAAFYVSATLLPQQVQTELRKHIDPVFMPRPLYRVAALPRNETGKLPLAALNTLLQQCRAAPAVTVPAGHPAIAGHFPGDPIVPAVLILSLVEEAVAERFPDVVLGTLQNARFHRPLRPEQGCRIETEKTGERIAFRVLLNDGANATLIAAGQWLCNLSTATP